MENKHNEISKILLKEGVISNPNAYIGASDKIIKKWKKYGLLEGLRNQTEKSVVALMLENQAKQILKEATTTGGPDSEYWNGVALPLVRRIFGEMFTKELLSVQPMSMPSGLVFYLDFQYGTDKNKFRVGQSIYGGTGDKFGRTDKAVNGLYGVGKYGYSLNNASFNLTKVQTVSGVKISHKDVNFAPELAGKFTQGSGGTVITPLRKITITVKSSDIHQPSAEAATAFNLAMTVKSSNNYSFVDFYPAYTKVTKFKDNTQIEHYAFEFIVELSTDTNDTITKDDFDAITIEYVKATSPDYRGDFEPTFVNNQEQFLNIPEINLKLKSETIVAQTRKLRAIWTPEISQDLAAYHNVDAEAELVSILSNYITMEIDLEMLEMLLNAAEEKEYWSVRTGYEYNHATGAFEKVADDVYAYQRNTWFQTLGVKIQKISNLIHQKTLRGGANFIVCSPAVATILESMPGFNADPTADLYKFAMGVSKIGNLYNKYTVYKVPYLTSNVILVGFKGDSFFDTGAVYAPYVPLMLTPVIYEPNNFTPRRGIMTRYAKKVVKPEFYGLVVVEGLETL